MAGWRRCAASRASWLAGRFGVLGLDDVVQSIDVFDGGAAFGGDGEDDATVAEGAGLDEVALFEAFDQRADGGFGAEVERAEVFVLLRGGGGVGITQHDGREAGAPPSVRRAQHSQNGLRLGAFVGQTGIGRWWRGDAVVAGGAALDDATAQVGVDVPVTAAGGFDVGGDFVHALVLDRFVAFEQRRDAFGGVGGWRRDVDGHSAHAGFVGEPSGVSPSEEGGFEGVEGEGWCCAMIWGVGSRE